MYYFNVFVAIQTQNVKNDVNFYYGSNISDALLLYNSTYVEGGEGSDYYILSSRSRVHDKIIINNTAYDQALDFLVMPKENVELDLRQDDKKLLINVKETDDKYTVSVIDYFKNKEKHLAIKHNKLFYKVPFIDNDNNINLIPLYTISSELYTHRINITKVDKIVLYNPIDIKVYTIGLQLVLLIKFKSDNNAPPLLFLDRYENIYEYTA